MNPSIRKTFMTLIIIAFALVVLHLLTVLLGSTSASDLPQLLMSFHLDKEANIPTWYSTILLFAVSFSSYLIYYFQNKIPGEKKRFSKFWLNFSLVYCFFSLDEAARIHELIDKMISVKWIYFFAPFAAAFFIYCFIYFSTVNPGNKILRNWMIGGLIIYALGGMGFEAIDHIFRPLPPLIQNLEYAFEEGLEMIGTSMVLTGCIIELTAVYNKTKIPQSSFADL